MTTIQTAYDPGALGLNVLRKTGEELLCLCPYHDDTKPSATYNPLKGLFHCFTCKESKTASELAKDLGGSLVKVTNVEALRERSGDSMDWMNLLKNPLVPAGSRAHLYMADRKVRYSQIEDYGIMANLDGVIFPLGDRFDMIIGVIVRHFIREPKYMFYGERPPIWPYKNLGNRKANSEVTYIVEGVFGVLRLERWYNAVASMGTGHTSYVGQLLKSNSNNPISFFDPDYAGRLAAGKLMLAYRIPALLNDKCADEIVDAREVEDFSVTSNIMDLINASPQSKKLEAALLKFWRKL